MPSTLPGFEYDIFISYRHKDNEYEGWVTEFVDNLRKELRATFKEDISIYFDENPHDGLLEMYNVDKSLEGKLKCLILIPIISQTYCDTKSFAWRHEFCAFNKIAKEDQFGRDIKLSNGNVVSRILQVKIHDLDTEDKALLENELMSALRAVDFIYKEPGVNRPLKPSDNKNDNQNRTDYRNQVNKIANAIKEIITSLKNPVTQPIQPTENVHPSIKSIRSKRTLIAISFLLLLGIAGYFLYPTLFSSDKEDEVLDKSIAVLPFVNMSNDPEQEYFSDGITEEITARLSKIGGLKVKSRTSVLQYKNQKKTAKLIAEELGVNNILEGSVRKQGNKVLITAQLINGETDEHIWSETYNRELKDIFEVQSDIAQQIAKKFQTNLSEATQKKLVTPPTLNTEAYDLYLKASTLSFLETPGSGGEQPNRQKAITLLKQAIKLDPSFSDAYALLSKNYVSYSTDAPYPKHWLDSAILLAGKAIDLNPDRERGYVALANVKYWEGQYDESLKLLLKAHEITPFSTVGNIVNNYIARNEYGKAFEWVMRGMEYDPAEPAYYSSEAWVYYSLGLLDSMKNCIDRARRINSESSAIDGAALNYYWFTGNYEEYLSLCKKLFALDEKEYANNIGMFYLFQRNWKKADSCYAISSQPHELDAGLVKIQLGKKEQGRLFLEKAIQTRIRFLGFNTVWHNHDISRAYAALQDKRYIDYFNKALERGWHFYAWIELDPFFDLVRETPEFKKLGQKVYVRNEGFKADLYKSIKRYNKEKNN